MAYASKDLSVLAYANGFTLWHYATADRAADVAAGGYFNAAGDLLRTGDMILLNSGGDAPTASVAATIVVVAGTDKGAVTVTSLAGAA